MRKVSACHIERKGLREREKGGSHHGCVWWRVRWREGHKNDSKRLVFFTILVPGSIVAVKLWKSKTNIPAICMCSSPHSLKREAAAMHRVKTRDRHTLTLTVTHTPHTHTHRGWSLFLSWLRGGGTGVKWFKWSRAYTGVPTNVSVWGEAGGGGIFQGPPRVFVA